MKRRRTNLDLPLRLLRVTGALSASAWLVRRGVRILGYHGCWTGPNSFEGDFLFINPKTFVDRLRWIAEHRFPVIPLSEAIASLQNGVPMPRGATVITIDDGWYSSFSVMRPALLEFGFPATLYVDTGNLLRGTPVAHVMAQYFWKVSAPQHRSTEAAGALQMATATAATSESRLSAATELGRILHLDVPEYLRQRTFAYMTPEELRAFASSDLFDIQLHSHNHTLGDHSPELTHREISDNRTSLAKILDRAPDSFRHFCYPSGDFDPRDRIALSTAGIASATSTQRDIVRTDDDLLLLPRLLDGNEVSPERFGLEMYGLWPILRRLMARRGVGWDQPPS